jgi:CheY-like chemotaxis protein
MQLNKLNDPSRGLATRNALVVDDEPVVRNFLCGALEDIGFTITEAGTATAALQAVSQQPDNFSVAFIDLGLPDLSGLELISELRKLQPDLPIVIASGYGEMAKRDMDESNQSSAVLVKPYDAEVIEKVLIDLGI